MINKTDKTTALIFSDIGLSKKHGLYIGFFERYSYHAVRLYPTLLKGEYDFCYNGKRYSVSERDKTIIALQ